MGDEWTEDRVFSEQTNAEAAADAQTGGRLGLKRYRKVLLLLAPVLLLLGGLYVYLNGGRYESTDDAFLQTGMVSISPDVSGRVIAVAVHKNQRVRKGQVLFRIDPAPFKAEVAQAEAQLQNARTEVAAQRATYRKGRAQAAAAREQVRYAEREAARQKQLLAEGISSQNQYDQAVLAAKTAQQNVETALQQNESVQARLSGDVGAPVESQPAVKAAQAALDRARLNLGYTVVRADQDGVVANVDQLQVGDYVTAGKPLFTEAGTRIWVEANFKEDQLQYMRLGQRATVEVDAFPDLHLTGRVSSFSPGTGNAFSVLPAENATGNWVKVVQRLPVEITLDKVPSDIPLHAGLSVIAEVDTGHERRLFGPDIPPRTPQAAQQR
ncbi:HlyD family secretion protein [Stakelama sp. CBK3Z-3]|uniref:HlyD family secretion protein n=1 Tax=Stakelama flava TaxID=2860338 RepID=A0ABS6XQG3_9SPHN|nr:HlyD family secretion protein [Stakelama flava]MBW4332023.1 HlyD family secretion protein [Stakelama flava]